MAEGSELMTALEHCTDGPVEDCPACQAALKRHPLAPPPLASNLRSFQSRVWSWCIECFKRPDSLSSEQRAFRFMEEAIELVQAIGTSREDVLRLVDYVYERPAGADRQELGGVLVTLGALSQSLVLDMEVCGEAELRRCVANTEKIRAKDLAKPQRSPLPGGSPAETESPHDITCNYRRRPLFSDGCICKVVNKHEYELLERVFGDATDETIARHRLDMTSPVKTSTSLADGEPV